MKPTTVEVFAGRGRRLFYFHAKARNGKIIAQSEGYTRKADAARGARRAFPTAKIVYR